MPLYHVSLIHNEQRAVIAVDHVLEEYGVSEQEFVSTWFMDRPEIQGDGDTVEEAIQKLFNNLSRHESMIKQLSPDIMHVQHLWARMTKSAKTKFRTPVIG